MWRNKNTDLQFMIKKRCFEKLHQYATLWLEFIELFFSENVEYGFSEKKECKFSSKI